MVERQPLLLGGPASSSSSAAGGSSSSYVALDLSGVDEDTPLLAIRPEDVDGVLEQAGQGEDEGDRQGAAQGGQANAAGGGGEGKAKAKAEARWVRGGSHSSACLPACLP